MTSYQPGDPILVTFPFFGGPQAKARPALVLLDTGNADVLVARVTSRPARTSYEVPLSHWQTAGLSYASVVRLHKLATLDKKLVHRVLGKIDPADRQQVSAVLNQTFGNW